MKNKCYIISAAQVSCQKPLSDDWLKSPCIFEGKYVPAVEPDAKGLISPSEARRMGKVLKRAVCTALTALGESGVCCPDAVIMGTGMGCMENSEKFLIDICRYGENCLKPTLFMQSTHNTVSSLISIVLKCHGYNTTYSHGTMSFDSALLDAWLQITGGRVRNALVGSHDEVTPLMARVFERTHPEFGFMSETSVSSVLSADSTGDDVALQEVKVMSRASVEEISREFDEKRDPVILAGINGVELNDWPYRRVFESIGYSPVILRYKNIFGENFSSSAMAFYVGVSLLKTGTLPEQMIAGQAPLAAKPSLSSISILNHSLSSGWSVIRLKR